MKYLIERFKQSHPAGKKLLLLQILAHTGLVWMFFYGTLIQWIGSLVIYSFMIGVGITSTYHRLLAHKSFQAPTWFKNFGILCGVISSVGSPITFVSQHRDHHRFLDTSKDAYSPKNKPWWYVQWFTMLEVVSLKSAPDLIRDKVCMKAHIYFFHIHLIYALICLLIDPLALIYLYLAPMAIAWNMSNSLNSICHQYKKHMFSYRHEGQKDSSVCVAPLGIITFGEAWHSNHHEDARNISFSKKWWELDLGYWIIRMVRLKQV